MMYVWYNTYFNKRFLSEREKNFPILVGHGKLSKSGIRFRVQYLNGPHLTRNSISSRIT